MNIIIIYLFATKCFGPRWIMKNSTFLHLMLYKIDYGTGVPVRRIGCIYRKVGSVGERRWFDKFVSGRNLVSVGKLICGIWVDLGWKKLSGRAKTMRESFPGFLGCPVIDLSLAGRERMIDGVHERWVERSELEWHLARHI